jgi:hypothetical protein
VVFISFIAASASLGKLDRRANDIGVGVDIDIDVDLVLLFGADARAAFVANCLRGALPPVDFRAISPYHTVPYPTT